MSENRVPERVEVAIVGAGPYGLSIAAYLNRLGIPNRIFGDAMSFWSSRMPKGMRLKSDGFASSLADPDDEFTLRRYCELHGIPYHDEELPVNLEIFIAYGHAFQRKFVPNLEDAQVLSISRVNAEYQLKLDTGEIVHARCVVMAIGILPFTQLPDVLADLPRTHVSHSSDHSNLDQFRGRRVAVVGAGSSALDTAALLAKHGAAVQIIARSVELRFHHPPEQRGFLSHLLRPTTGIGAGLDLWFYTVAPRAFRLLPESLRLDRMRKTLGPSGGWFTRSEIEGKVPVLQGCEIRSAQVSGGEVIVAYEGSNQSGTLIVDHVIAATGYRVDVERIDILEPRLRTSLRTTSHSPQLSSFFESSQRGLYFVGVASACTFGPMMRFAYGARYTALRLSRHLARNARRQ